MSESDGLSLPAGQSLDVGGHIARSATGTPKLRKFHTPKNLRYEIVRLSTFHNWTVSFINAADLAKSGFFYLTNSDHVQCAFCQGVVGFWEEGDKPETEHKKHFPHCPLFQQNPSGNVPLISTTDNNVVSKCYKLLEEYLIFRLDFTKPLPQTSSRIQRDSDVIESHVCHPVFATYQSRQATYGSWPASIKVMPDKLAEAGFFYTGLSDFVTCFNCGGGLFNWNSCDASSDPWVDHAKYYGQCPFVRLNKSTAFVNSQQDCLKIEPAARKSIIFKEEEIDLLLNHPIAQRVIRMGLSTKSVKACLKRSMETNCYFPGNLSETLEMVVDWEEEYCEIEQMDNSSVPLLDSDSIKITNQSNQQNQDVMSFSKLNLESKNARRYHVSNTVEELREQINLETSRLNCKICKNARVSVVLMPCHHYHLCSKCSRGRSTCPTCGAVVRGTLIPVIV